MSTLIPNEKVVIENGWNVMLIGLHGTGKSASIRSIADRHNMKVAIFNAATMDPNTELIGIPMPRKVHVYDAATGTTVLRESLEMIRPHMIDDCEMVFIDEMNRAPIEVQNALMELANERTINGSPLPKLRTVMTAINPPDGDYHVGLIDPAMADRWDIYVEVVPEVSEHVLHAYDGISKPVAKALATWYRECDHAKRETYVSPRRVGKLGKVFEATRSKKMLQTALPPGTTADIGKLYAMLMEAVGKPLAGSAGDKKLAATGSEVEGSAVTPASKPKATATPTQSGVEWVKAKHVNPVMLPKVEVAAVSVGYDVFAQHLTDMPQSTSYRFGKKLGAMIASGQVAASDIPTVVLAYNDFARSTNAKSLLDHRRAAEKAQAKA